MKLVADEGIDRQIVEALRASGIEVTYIAEMEPGVSDDVVLGLAHDRSSLLLTADKDFGELVFRQRARVVLLRLSGLRVCEKTVASEGRSSSAGAQEPECMLKYMRIPSTARTRDPERSRFFHKLSVQMLRLP